MFIKRVYLNIIENYFSEVSFFKPTGDGLLIMVPFTEHNLQERVEHTVASCLAILTHFGNFCSNDPMVNFDVPRRVGIGISRGTACRLVSGKKILDYSGRVLNLASRLMDLARPTGIVFDSDFGIDLLTDDQADLFAKENIYLKGIAEKEPIDIWFTKDITEISPFNKQPMERIKWNVDKEKMTLKEIRVRPARFWYDLQVAPIDPSEIKVKITYPGIRKGRKVRGFVSFFDFPNFEYILEAGKPKLAIEFGVLAERLSNIGVRDNWGIKIEIMYPGI